MIIAKNNENLIDDKVLKELMDAFGLNKSVAEILINRGYNTKEKVNEFLFSGISNLKDPFLLLNMKEVVARIEKAIENNEKILIFGDYDVDGICATSILYNYLTTKTENVKTYLPNRFEDGYGLSCPCIDKIAKKEKPDLIITVDCGISCEKEVEFIKLMGIDIIVTDHHVLPEKLPKCLIINTKFCQKFNFDGLCGAGVAFKIVQALCYNQNENFEKYLAIASIATIADIVPLVDENRIIVKEGLKRLDMLPIGVKILFKDTFKTLKGINSSNVAFKIAPKINSAGRLDDANIALKLFVSDDLKEINKSLKLLEELNNKRKLLCEKIYNEAKLQLKNFSKNNKIIVLFNKDWDVGVLGIVCAKLCEEFELPVVLFGKINDELKGSCRTVGNVDAVKIFENSKEILINFGGHQKAGGLSIKEENLKNFVNNSNEFLKQYYSDLDFMVKKTYDLELNENDITNNFVKSLEIFQPCGFENNTPVFKLVLGAVKVNKLQNLSQHLLIKTHNNIDFISFNDEKNFENYQNFDKKIILAEFEINKFRNKESVKGLIKYSSFDCPNNVLNQKLRANYLTQLTTICENEFKPKYYTSLKQIENIFDNKTLFLTYNQNLETIFPGQNQSSFSVNQPSVSNLLFGLKSCQELNNFNKIILTEKPINKDFVNFLNIVSGANIYVPTNCNFRVKLDASRENFLNVYYNLIMAINKNVCAENEYSYFELLQTKFGAKFDFITFFASILVFKELKLIEEKHNQSGKIFYKLNKIKTDLTKSVIFQKLNAVGN